jgi:hypothetical protein
MVNIDIIKRIIKWSKRRIRFELKREVKSPIIACETNITEIITEGKISGNIRRGITNVLDLEYMVNEETRVPTIE